MVSFGVFAMRGPHRPNPIGMHLVRTFHADWPVRIDGDEHGDVEYAITMEEWEQAISRSVRADGPTH